MSSSSDSGNVTNRDSDSRKIVIIGCGIAGLAAANYLYDAGYRNLHIFDCRDKFGGRIRTEGDIDLGPQWLYGCDNIIYELALKLGLVLKRIPEREIQEINTIGYRICLMENGESISSKIREKVEFDFGMMIARCADITHLPDSTSLGDYLVSEFDSLYDCMRKCDPPLFELHSLVFKYMMRRECVITGCDDLHSLSLMEYSHHGRMDSSFGTVHQLYPGSFSTIFNVLADNLPPDSISFQHKLMSAEMKDNCQVQLKFECTDESEKIVAANYVILTISLGCLKKDAENILGNMLTRSKERAIVNLGFGIVNKFALFFESDVVSPNTGWINLLWDEKSLDLNNRPWYSYIVHFHCIEPSILIGWVSGEAAIQYEQLSDAQIIEDSMLVLSRFFGHKLLSRCKKVIRTFWHSDYSTRGSYSYVPINGSLDDISELSRPIYYNDSSVPKILFAGEATSTVFYSTVHGAYESGIREAKRLVDYFDGMSSHVKSDYEEQSSDISDTDRPSFFV